MRATIKLQRSLVQAVLRLTLALVLWMTAVPFFGQVAIAAGPGAIMMQLVESGADACGADTLDCTRSTPSVTVPRPRVEPAPAKVRNPIGGNGVATAVPVALTWNATDPDGIAGYEVQRSIAGGEFRTVKTGATNATRIVENFYLRQLTDYQFRVRVIDGAGVWSDWVNSRPFELYAFQETHAALAFTGDWTREIGARFSGGGAVFSEATGERVTATFAGTNVGWISSTGPGMGVAEVYVDGVFRARIDLWSATNVAGVVAYSSTSLPNGEHTIEICNIGRSDNTGESRISVDAIVAVQR